MARFIKKEISNLNKKEVKFLKKVKKDNVIKEKINTIVPIKLRSALELAFVKAFQTIFLHGASVIEKTFDKEDISLEFEANQYILDKKETRKNVKRLDKMSQKSNLVNNALVTTSGLGLGLLGMGLPDIPILVAGILKGVYQIALSYGFSYDTTEEKIYILRLIRVALASNEMKLEYNQELEGKNYANTSLEEEIVLTAKVLSEELLIEKFVQGIPIIGIIGAVVNHMIYKKITKISVVKYKKRYLEQKASVHL